MSDVQLSRDLGFLRLGAAAPVLRVADVDFNVAAIVEVLNKASAEGVQVVTLPEMALTGYTIGDLVHHAALLSKAERGLSRILRESTGNGRLVVVGMPVATNQGVFNCAVVLNSGRILGVVPKTLQLTMCHASPRRLAKAVSTARPAMASTMPMPWMTLEAISSPMV